MKKILKGSAIKTVHKAKKTLFVIAKEIALPFLFCALLVFSIIRILYIAGVYYVYKKKHR